MKSRPGATKRKEKLEKAERERFGKNMAQMASKVGTGTEQRAENKWAALRSFIAGTMEKKEEFVEKGK
jgi:pyruvate-formate lyase